MQLSITGHHIDVTEPLKMYVEEKLDKLDRHSDQITNVHVVLSVEKLVQRAEATVHVSGGELFADASTEDLYKAIDQLSDKLDRQLIKHKEKSIGRHHQKP